VLTPPNPSRIIAPIAPARPPPPATDPGTSEFSDCPTCPVMSRIAAGGFTMGQGAKEAEAMPPHRVAIRAFAIGRYPVTIAEWQACVADGGCKSMPRMATADGRVPVHNVSWDDASQFIAWLSRVSGQRYRLPSEAEWEYAARGGTTSRYWWGEAVGVSLANCLDCGGTQNPRAPMPVDLYKPNPFGLVGMLGGVAQWTADCWFETYQGAPSDGSARDLKGCDKRVLRGGSYRSNHDDLAVMARNNYDQSVRYQLNGFRVARDLK
jgi:formylglycine-generating enzyme required for sulfatase activity